MDTLSFTKLHEFKFFEILFIILKILLSMLELKKYTNNYLP